MRSFNNVDGIKEEIRELICTSAIDNKISVKRICTLPAKEMLCVKTFKKHFPTASITGLEREKKDFKNICENAVPGLVMENMTIGQFADKSQLTTHYDIVFLDYFGPLNNARLSEVTKFINNKNILHYKKDSIIALTFMKHSRQGRGEVFDLIEESFGLFSGLENSNTVENITGVVMSRLQSSSITYINSFEYTNNGGVPMYFILLKLVG